MANYNFKLQKLLDIRINKEEESKREFKEAQRNKSITSEKLEELKMSYVKYSSFNPSDTLIEKKIKLNYLNTLNNMIVDTTSELERRDKILEEKREELKLKQVERKTVEILKDKQLENFIREQNLIEQKTNDEFALYSFIRKHERR